MDMLRSVFPAVPEAALARVLEICDGNEEIASEWLLENNWQDLLPEDEGDAETRRSDGLGDVERERVGLAADEQAEDEEEEEEEEREDLSRASGELAQLARPPPQHRLAATMPLPTSMSSPHRRAEPTELPSATATEVESNAMVVSAESTMMARAGRIVDGNHRQPRERSNVTMTPNDDILGQDDRDFDSSGDHDLESDDEGEDEGDEDEEDEDDEDEDDDDDDGDAHSYYDSSDEAYFSRTMPELTKRAHFFSISELDMVWRSVMHAHLFNGRFGEIIEFHTAACGAFSPRDFDELMHIHTTAASSSSRSSSLMMSPLSGLKCCLVLPCMATDEEIFRVGKHLHSLLKLPGSLFFRSIDISRLDVENNPQQSSVADLLNEDGNLTEESFRRFAQYRITKEEMESSRDGAEKDTMGVDHFLQFQRQRKVQHSLEVLTTPRRLVSVHSQTLGHLGRTAALGNNNVGTRRRALTSARAPFGRPHPTNWEPLKESAAMLARVVGKTSKHLPVAFSRRERPAALHGADDDEGEMGVDELDDDELDDELDDDDGDGHAVAAVAVAPKPRRRFVRSGMTSYEQWISRNAMGRRFSRRSGHDATSGEPSAKEESEDPTGEATTCSPSSSSGSSAELSSPCDPAVESAATAPVSLQRQTSATSVTSTSPVSTRGTAVSAAPRSARGTAGVSSLSTALNEVLNSRPTALKSVVDRSATPKTVRAFVVEQTPDGNLFVASRRVPDLDPGAALRPKDDSFLGEGRELPVLTVEAGATTSKDEFFGKDNHKAAAHLKYMDHMRNRSSSNANRDDKLDYNQRSMLPAPTTSPHREESDKGPMTLDELLLASPPKPSSSLPQPPASRPVRQREIITSDGEEDDDNMLMNSFLNVRDIDFMPRKKSTDAVDGSEVHGAHMSDEEEDFPEYVEEPYEDDSENDGEIQRWQERDSELEESDGGYRQHDDDDDDDDFGVPIPAAVVAQANAEANADDPYL
ncbi:hypothetical protein P43SY_002356 [Pythium insidiosum]|uniref:CUE domain-containing protein n=1 Tax=Pythium insidiosum TaxID=114742 RepID=A0AAD5MBR6_PYTIN|nr:hypothetical protein P43SY_002356 [Pythium insidiosum]